MSKVIIVINGSGGVGKDTLCNFVAEEYKVVNVSSVDPIKEMAKIVGWEGKELKDRAFLSDLKTLCTQYNNSPFTYIMRRTSEFLNPNSEDEILFVHIREPQEIEKYCEGCYTAFGFKPFTLLVQRDVGVEKYGNKSDDNVEDYCYDIYFNNNYNLTVAKVSILNLVDKLIKEER